MRTFSILLATASVLAFNDHAFAQEASARPGGDDTGSEIVVTAQRRAEKVTEVPISITVVNAAQLERQQVNTVSDLARVSPSLEVNGGSQSLGGGGQIRGVGTQTFSAGAQASVGVVVDQVSQGNVNISDLFDIGRVEVLKGPQGTLFGLTTSAGVINITTNAPRFNETSVRVRTELSSSGFAGSEYGQQVVQGVVNLPLASNAAIRVSASGNFRQGPGRNLSVDGEDHFNRYSTRARLLWEPVPNVKVNLIGDYSRSTSRGSDFFTFIQDSPFYAGGAAGAASTTKPTLATLLATCGITVAEGNTDYCTNVAIRTKNENYGGSLSVEGDFGPIVATSITSLRKSRIQQNSQSIFRADPLGNAALLGANPNDTTSIVANPHQDESNRLFTQELRFSSQSGVPLEFTFGSFYSHLLNTQQPRTTVNKQPGRPAATQTRGLITIKDESLAAFGQATLHAADGLRLIAGGRWTSEKLSYAQVQGAATAANKSTFTAGSFRFGAQYDVAPRTMIYSTVNRGFKGGQITVSNDITVVPQIILPERPMAYEVGLKTTLFGSWVLDLNAFHQSVKNFQTQNCTLSTTTGLFSCAQINIDKVLSRGAEINLFGKVTDGLTLNTGFIYAKTTYESSNPIIGKSFSGATNVITAVDIRGQQVAFAPLYKFTMSGEYEHELSSSLKGFLGLDTVWKSRVSYQQSTQASETFEPHWIVGGRIGVRTDDDRMTASIFVRNLFNVHEPVTLQQPLANSYREATAAIYGTNGFRQVGLSLDAKF